ncbi:MAG: 4Fe-4S dicluster domain-containing protein [Deltaproteobacteria bacterium]|nr:4Fe-4S dicluster domain-containing protein [Deltaproteobacteria bacterium]
MGEVAAPLAELHPGTLDCVHCGLCLPVCPTYRETGRETSSPRGRVYLLRGVAEGEIPLGDVVAEEAALCLGCRACETACPSGVRFGSLIERARARVTSAGLRDAPARRLERFALRQLVPHRARLHLAVGLVGLGQRLGLDRPVLRLLPEWLRSLAPRVPPRRERRRLPRVVAARGTRPPRACWRATASKWCRLRTRAAAARCRLTPATRSSHAACWSTTLAPSPPSTVSMPSWSIRPAVAPSCVKPATGWGPTASAWPHACATCRSSSTRPGCVRPRASYGCASATTTRATWSTARVSAPRRASC